MNTPIIAAFARLAKEDTLPVRILEGQKTLITRTMHNLSYNAVNDEIVVSSPFNQAILTFRGGAGGEEAPIRFIRGPKTQILGTDYDGNDKAFVDGDNGEILIPVGTNTSPYESILVFDRLANGDVAPKRVLSGPDTLIKGTRAGHAGIAIDPKRDLMVVKSAGGGPLLVFNRTASGNAKPLKVIQGPKSGIGVGGAGGGGGQIGVTPSGMIVTACAGGAICAWSVNDTGDVPARWRIPVQQLTNVAPSGVALNPFHKEIIVPSGARNVVQTYYWPEVFDDAASTTNNN